MSDGRKVHCYKCGKYLGEIRDATLRKNIYHICEFCASVEVKPKQKAATPNVFDSIFGDIFGGRHPA